MWGFFDCFLPVLLYSMLTSCYQQSETTNQQKSHTVPKKQTNNTHKVDIYNSNLENKTKIHNIILTDNTHATAPRHKQTDPQKPNRGTAPKSNDTHKISWGNDKQTRNLTNPKINNRHTSNSQHFTY